MTFLTTPDHKAALDAFAAESGQSVGHVVREASSRYIAQPRESNEFEEALRLALPDLEATLARMNATVDHMRGVIATACAAVDAALAGDPR